MHTFCDPLYSYLGVDSIAILHYIITTEFSVMNFNSESMSLLPDTSNCGLRMRRECRESFLRHLLQRKPLVSDPGMHHGTCVTHVPWCMSGSLTRGGGENVPGIPGACATRNLTYLLRDPWDVQYDNVIKIICYSDVSNFIFNAICICGILT